jgi:hypothetical protein
VHLDRPVREVQPEGVSPCHDQLLQLLRGGDSRTNRAEDLRLVVEQSNSRLAVFAHEHCLWNIEQKYTSASRCSALFPTASPPRFGIFGASSTATMQ